METLPMPLQALSEQNGGLDEFRISDPYEIQALLRQLCDTGALLTLCAPNGSSYTTMLWAVDASRNVVCFSAETHDPRLHAMLEAGEVVAVGYLDSIKLQFDVTGLVMVRSGANAALNAGYPKEIYRFQRRSSYRVKPLLNNVPAAHMRHPAIPDMRIELRILDLSLGGVALFLPDDLPDVEPGVQINDCQIELDADTILHVGLLVHHVTSLNHESKGKRLGCEMTGVDSGTARDLQRYIDYTQKRRYALGQR